jgi:hypothetical protein
MVSVKDPAFGAVGDGVTDDTAALSAALAYAMNNGVTLMFPEGIYNYSSPINLTLPARNNYQTERTINLQGTGSANCGLNWLGDKDTTGLTIRGTMPNSDRLKINGLRFVRPDSGPTLQGSQGAALCLENLSDVGIDDCTFFRHGYGLQLIGCLIVALNRCSLIYNDIGLRCEQGSFTSTPNVISISNSNLGANYSRGASFTKGSQNSFVNCLFENTGENVNANSIAVELTYLGGAGAVGTSFERCYFEGNKGTNIYWYAGHDMPQTLSVTNCNFNRFPGYDKQSIVADFHSRTPGSSKALLRIAGSTFYGYGGYSPDPAKPHLTFGVGGGYDGLTLAGLDETLFQSPVDVGTIPSLVNQV